MTRLSAAQKNAVSLAGKVSRSGKLAYTPSGLAVLEFTLAAPQRYFDKESVGYFDVLLVGDEAESLASKVRVGRELSLTGSLWTRSFRNRRGEKMIETKVLAKTIGGYDEKE